MLHTVIILKGYAMCGLSDISDLACIDFEQLPASAELPVNFPDSATVPKFLYGDRVKWRLLPDEDEIKAGVIIGRFYAYAPHRVSWGWKYLILLDAESYSIKFCAADTAGEECLEAITEEDCDYST